MHRSNLLKAEPLTAAGFAAFGDVVETVPTQSIAINQGFATRLDTKTTIDVENAGGKTMVSLFHAIPRPLPIAIKLMERHPLGSQLFQPLQDEDWFVLVCADPKDQASYRAFRATGQQGVNYHRNVWHHPLLVAKPSRFIIIDRQGPGNNLEEYWLGESDWHFLPV
jgi:ureidoglycolate lyase